MIEGINKFIEYFRDYPGSYIVIGGTACDMVIDSAGFEPRATVDIDIVLIVEALKPEFVTKFWEFIIEGKYNTRQKDMVKRNCYRFCNNQTEGFPKQIELFSKTPDIIDLNQDAHLTPIPVDEGLSNLSAILLNEDYYNFTLAHSVINNHIHIANIEALICLKAYAYLDNKKRKEAGQKIRTRDIVKHKYDVFRMVFLMRQDDVFVLPETIQIDLQKFADEVKNDLPDPAIFKNNGFGEQNLETIFNQLLKSFQLK